MRHFVFDLGLTAIASQSEKLLIQQCYEKCGVGKDDLGRQRVIDVRADISTEVRAILTTPSHTTEFDHELDWVSPVFSPHGRQRWLGGCCWSFG